MKIHDVINFDITTTSRDSKIPKRYLQVPCTCFKVLEAISDISFLGCISFDYLKNL